MAQDSPLLRFHAGEGTDAAGRRLGEILAWDDARLERVHDYIQWVFPLPERSAYNPAAPVLAAADIAAFRADAVLRARLRAAFRRMLAFYGLALDEGEAGPAVRKAANFASRAQDWLTPGNHNLLRITRILRCLRLLGLEADSRAFLACLEAICEEGAARVVGPVTLRYWREAARGAA